MHSDGDLGRQGVSGLGARERVVRRQISRRWLPVPLRRRSTYVQPFSYLGRWVEEGEESKYWSWTRGMIFGCVLSCLWWGEGFVWRVVTEW